MPNGLGGDRTAARSDTIFAMRILACTLISLALLAQSPQSADEFSTTQGVVRITPIQHASLMIEAGGQVIHVDPVGEARYQGLPPADLILLTHHHGDHLDTRLLPKLRKAGTLVLAPEAVLKAVPDAVVMRNGDKRTFGPWGVEAVPAYNLQRGPAAGRLYHEKGQGNGYVLSYGGKRFYISGDTEAVPEMKALRSIDVAFLCMNLPYTMTPEEAADAARAFQPKVLYPYHYRNSDLAVLQKLLAGTAIEVRLRDWYR